MRVPICVCRLKEILDQESISLESFVDRLGYTRDFTENLIAGALPNVFICLQVASVLCMSVEDIWFIDYVEADL